MLRTKIAKALFNAVALLKHRDSNACTKIWTNMYKPHIDMGSITRTIPPPVNKESRGSLFTSIGTSKMHSIRHWVVFDRSMTDPVTEPVGADKV